MKKRMIIIIGIFILICIIFIMTYFIYNNFHRCGFYYPKKCDYSCETNEDCYISEIQCVNKNEKYSIPRGIKVDVFVTGCECVGGKCENR